MARYIFASVLTTNLLLVLVALIGWHDLSWLDRSRLVDITQLMQATIIIDALQFLAFLVSIVLAVNALCVTPSYILLHDRKVFIPFFSAFLFIVLTYAIIGYSVQAYPYLEISQLSESHDENSPYKTVGLISAVTLAGIIIASLIKARKKNKLAIAGILASVIFFITPVIPLSGSSVFEHQSDTNKQPNIFIIGIDSVSYNQIFTNPEIAPYLHSRLSSGNNYTQAYTPLARTYAAWHSILSGQYPVTSGARYNLTNFNKIDKSQLLTKDLKDLGYYTVYAQDERRFNNIDEAYFFDITIGPKVGVLDFILPLFSDNPYTAYFTNSVVGKSLAPYLYNNRVNHYTYQPSRFAYEAIEGLKDTPQNQPVFFAAHFCLAHFPYKWSTYYGQYSMGKEETLHRIAITELDSQVKLLFEGLGGLNRLDNSIVIILSDHGEGVGASPDTWIPKHAAPYDMFSSVVRGHGNSLLAIDQNHIVMNITDNRLPATPRNIDIPASLIDIRPTILGMLNQPIPPDIDGIDLSASLPAQRAVFMETAVVVPPPSPTATPEELAESVKHNVGGYRITTEGRLVVTREFENTNTPKKYFGVIDNTSLVVASPLDNEQLLLIHTEEREWDMIDKNDEEHRDKINLLECYKSGKLPCQGVDSSAISAN